MRKKKWVRVLVQGWLRFRLRGQGHLLCTLPFCTSKLLVLCKTAVACVNHVSSRNFFLAGIGIDNRLPFFFPLAALPDTSRFLLKAVFAWVPEFLFPGLAEKGIPCPRCGGDGKPERWSTKGQRRVHMEHDVAFLIGFR